MAASEAAEFNQNILVTEYIFNKIARWQPEAIESQETQLQSFFRIL